MIIFKYPPLPERAMSALVVLELPVIVEPFCLNTIYHLVMKPSDMLPSALLRIAETLVPGETLKYSTCPAAIYIEPSAADAVGFSPNATQASVVQTIRTSVMNDGMATLWAAELV